MGMQAHSTQSFRSVCLALWFTLTVVGVSGAPTFFSSSKSKMEPRCSHKSEETLCWTVQFRRPLRRALVSSSADSQQSPSHDDSSNGPSLKYSPSDGGGTISYSSNNGLQSKSVYDKMASHLAKETGLTLLGRVGEFEDHFKFCHDGTAPGVGKSTVFQDYHRAHSDLLKKDGQTFIEVRSQVEKALQNHQDVAWFSMETVHQRQKRSVTFNDPAFGRQWHLVNRLEIGMDINVMGVWERGITGKGVTVAVVDDGLEWDNPDIHSNYNIDGSWDLNDNDPDPMPNSAKVSNHHGTRCAGEIAAVANNSVCGVGVAYKAKVAGIRLLDGPMTDSLEAEAFNKKFNVNGIYSCSWGPDDDGKTVDGPHLLAAKAMKYGVDFGRHGYGSIFVVASGNGGSKQDNCNYDGYANSIYTVTIGAVDESGAMPYYAEECASMLGVTFSSGIASKRDIVTTDWRYKGGTGCTDRHTGTSAAAPLAAGMIALMLDAQPCLTWRDVQYIIIMTAVKVDVDLAHWQKNGAGLEHSHKHGFGLLSAWRMVNAARVWRTVPWMSSFSQEDSAGWDIPRGPNTHLTVTHTVTSDDISGYSLYMLEYIQVTVTLTHPVRGKLGIQLLCPSGTSSMIGAPRPNDNSTEGFSDWTFTTVRCWGEAPTGDWKLLIIDEVPADSSLRMGRLVKWRLTLFGTPMTPAEFQKRRKEVEQAMKGHYLSANYTPPCNPPPVTTPPYIPLSEKTLKILFLASAFCLVFAVYETFEYMLCYNDEKREHQAERARQARNASSESYRHGEEGTPETDRLLSQEDGSASRDLSFPDLLQNEEDEDDMFLMDGGIAAGRRQTRTRSTENGGTALGTENIPMSLFNPASPTAPSTLSSGGHSGARWVGNSEPSNTDITHNDSRSQVPSQAGIESHNLPSVPNGASFSQTSEKHLSPSTNNESTPAKGRTATNRAHSKKSILPEMWRALTQEKDESDSEGAEDEIFSRRGTSSKTPLLQNGSSENDR